MSLFDAHEDAVARGDWVTALRYASEIAERGPQFATCWFNVGVCHDALDQHMEAARSFQKAIAIEPSDATARFRMIRSLFLAGARQIVYEELKVMLDYDPGFISEMLDTESLRVLKNDLRFKRLLNEDSRRVADSAERD